MMKYPILPWDPQHGWDGTIAERQQGIASIAACHFGLAGFIGRDDLEQCRQHQLQGILYDPTVMPNKLRWNELSDQQLDVMVRRWTDGTTVVAGRRTGGTASNQMVAIVVG